MSAGPHFAPLDTPDALSAGNADAEEWDAFLLTLPGGNHLQTSLWAEAKRFQGWTASRLVLRVDGRIAAGLQILHRAVFRVGRVAYVPRGPVFANADDRLSGRLMQELNAFVRSQRLWYVAVQQPRMDDAFTAELFAVGFRATPFQVAPTATVLIELQRPDDVLLRDMRKNTRRGVRIGLQGALKVRLGGAVDLPAFHALLVTTGLRRGFSPPSLDYFAHMWKVFSSRGGIALFLAELGGVAVAGELDVTCGDTLVSKRAAWSGQHGDLRPNELLIWTAMRWGRERGLKYYDMDGVDPELAEVLERHAPAPAALMQTHHGFKLGFGGSLVMYPDNYELVCLPLLGFLHRRVWCRWLSISHRRRLLRRLGVL
jgi:peptidoglycan pentaglycine glycine transferase (the first glycine)